MAPGRSPCAQAVRLVIVRIVELLRRAERGERRIQWVERELVGKLLLAFRHERARLELIGRAERNGAGEIPVPRVIGVARSRSLGDEARGGCAQGNRARVAAPFEPAAKRLKVSVFRESSRRARRAWRPSSQSRFASDLNHAADRRGTVQRRSGTSENFDARDPRIHEIGKIKDSKPGTVQRNIIEQNEGVTGIRSTKTDVGYFSEAAGALHVDRSELAHRVRKDHGALRVETLAIDRVDLERKPA